MYNLVFDESFIKSFSKLSKTIQERIYKKIKKTYIKKRRHLKYGLPYFVENIGQYRVLYKLDENKKELIFLFIGKHKDYEKFYKEFKKK